MTGRRRGRSAQDAYRERVREMTATEHFGTDYRPVEPVREPTPTPRPGQCLCDAEPGVFAVFTFAVLDLHRPRRVSCSCGLLLDTCPIQSLASGLLFTPTPPRETR